MGMLLHRRGVTKSAKATKAVEVTPSEKKTEIKEEKKSSKKQ